MPATFLELTNRLLRRIKEVEVDSADFADCRGVQALAKDAIRSSLAHINRVKFEWPFNAAEHLQVLVAGQTEYTWPADFKAADYESFQIQRDASLMVNFKTLEELDRDIWYDKYRDRDYEAGEAGISSPNFVFESHGEGFGVTPSPNKAYSLRFRYWTNHVDLVLPEDQCRVPSSHTDVVVDGAVWYLYLMRDNTESAKLAFEGFNGSLKDMQTVFLPHTSRLYDTRLNHRATVGGSRWGTFYA